MNVVPDFRANYSAECEAVQNSFAGASWSGHNDSVFSTSLFSPFSRPSSFRRAGVALSPRAAPFYSRGEAAERVSAAPVSRFPFYN